MRIEILEKPKCLAHSSYPQVNNAFFADKVRILKSGPILLQVYTAVLVEVWLAGVWQEDNCSLLLQFSEGDHFMLWAVGNF